MKIFPSKKKTVLCVLTLITTAFVSISVSESKPAAGPGMLTKYLISTKYQDVLNAALNDDGGIDRHCDDGFYYGPKDE